MLLEKNGLFQNSLNHCCKIESRTVLSDYKFGPIAKQLRQLIQKSGLQTSGCKEKRSDLTRGYALILF